MLINIHSFVTVSIKEYPRRLRYSLVSIVGPKGQLPSQTKGPQRIHETHSTLHIEVYKSFNNNNNNNNNTLIYIAPACRMTSEALADSSSRATECLTEK